MYRSTFRSTFYCLVLWRPWWFLLPTSGPSHTTIATHTKSWFFSSALAAERKLILSREMILLPGPPIQPKKLGSLDFYWCLYHQYRKLNHDWVVVLMVSGTSTKPSNAKFQAVYQNLQSIVWVDEKVIRTGTVDHDLNRYKAEGLKFLSYFCY